MHCLQSFKQSICQRQTLIHSWVYIDYTVRRITIRSHEISKLRDTSWELKFGRRLGSQSRGLETSRDFVVKRFADLPLVWCFVDLPCDSPGGTVDFTGKDEHRIMTAMRNLSWGTIIITDLAVHRSVGITTILLFYVFQWIGVGTIPRCMMKYGILTHWGRVTHICVSKVTIIVSDNGLSPGRRQAIIWNNAGILLIGTLGTNFSEILIEILTFSFKKMGLKVSSAKRQPFSLGLNVLIVLDSHQKHHYSSAFILNYWWIHTLRLINTATKL